MTHSACAGTQGVHHRLTVDSVAFTSWLDARAPQHQLSARATFGRVANRPTAGYRSANALIGL